MALIEVAVRRHASRGGSHETPRSGHGFRGDGSPVKRPDGTVQPDGATASRITSAAGERERGGIAVTTVVRSEGQAVQAIAARVAPAATIHADEARGWDTLHVRFIARRVNHQDCYSDGQACTS